LGSAWKTARAFAQERNCASWLKGQRTLMPEPDVSFINLSDRAPRMATGGTGDILTA